MLIDLSKTRIYIRPGFTDMRKAINSLSVIVQDDMGGDLFSGSLFLFCNKQRRILKAVYWDHNGFCLWLKRLEKHRFPWPETKEAARELSREEFDLLMNGIDFFAAHTSLKYSKIC